jgi:membrane protein YdbS with pleckstrin-like domain
VYFQPNTVEKLHTNKKWRIEKMDMTDILIDFLILIIAAVIGFGIFYATSTSGWDLTVVAIWNYVPLVFIAVGIIALVVKLKYMGK